MTEKDKNAIVSVDHLKQLYKMILDIQFIDHKELKLDEDMIIKFRDLTHALNRIGHALYHIHELLIEKGRRLQEKPPKQHLIVEIDHKINQFIQEFDKNLNQVNRKNNLSQHLRHQRNGYKGPNGAAKVGKDHHQKDSRYFISPKSSCRQNIFGKRFQIFDFWFPRKCLHQPGYPAGGNHRV